LINQLTAQSIAVTMMSTSTLRPRTTDVRYRFIIVAIRIRPG